MEARAKTATALSVAMAGLAKVVEIAHPESKAFTVAAEALLKAERYRDTEDAANAAKREQT
jgi:hypothetical protein